MAKDEDDNDMDILLGSGNGNNGGESEEGEEEENLSADIELAIARAENLMSRRTLLLNYVLLQQNPHNVGEWPRRSELYLEGIRGGDSDHLPVILLRPSHHTKKSSKQSMLARRTMVHRQIRTRHWHPCTRIP